MPNNINRDNGIVTDLVLEGRSYVNVLDLEKNSSTLMTQTTEEGIIDVTNVEFNKPLPELTLEGNSLVNLVQDFNALTTSIVSAEGQNYVNMGSNADMFLQFLINTKPTGLNIDVDMLRLIRDICLNNSDPLEVFSPVERADKFLVAAVSGNADLLTDLTPENNIERCLKAIAANSTSKEGISNGANDYEKFLVKVVEKTMANVKEVIGGGDVRGEFVLDGLVLKGRSNETVSSKVKTITKSGPSSEDVVIELTNEIELCALANGVCDEFDVQTGKLTKRVTNDNGTLSQKATPEVSYITMEKKISKVQLDEKITVTSVGDATVFPQICAKLKRGSVHNLIKLETNSQYTLKTDGNFVHFDEAKVDLFAEPAIKEGEFKEIDVCANPDNSSYVEGINKLEVQGETLHNILPEPSLRNVIDRERTVQKLNEGYDDVNVVEGVFKNAVLEGRTLVNCVQVPSSQEVVLPYEFTEGHNVVIEGTKESGSLSTMLKGETLVNALQDLGAEDVVLPYEFTTGESVTIENTKENGALGVELQGRTLVNLSRPHDEREIVFTYRYQTYDVTNDIVKGGLKNGDKIFMSMEVNIHEINIETPYFRAGSCRGTVGYDIIKLTNDEICNLPKNTWVRLHVLREVVESLSTEQYSFWFGMRGEHPTNSGEQIARVSFRKPMWINLTSMFGSGKEPTLSECEKIPYFTGMTSVKAPTVKTVGKNLFDGKWEIGSLGNNNGIEAGGTSNVRSINYINVESNKTYKASSSQLQHANVVVWYAYDKDKKFISSSTTSNIFTTPSNCKFIRVRTFDSDSTNKSLDCVLQIEEGTQTTAYEPYTSSSLTLPEEVVLRSLPNGVCDTYNTRTGEYVRRIGEIVLDGSGDENWVKLLEANNWTNDKEHIITFRYPKPNNCALTWAKDGNECAYLSDKFQSVQSVDNYAFLDAEKLVFDRYDIKLGILKTKLNSHDVNGLKVYLQSNPIKVQYELETQIIKNIKDVETILKPHNTKTHIYTEIPQNTLKPVLKHANPTYPVAIKPNTQYSIIAKTDGNGHDNANIKLNLGGAEKTITVGTKVVTVTTPNSKLTHTNLVMSGRGNKLSKVMVLEGDYTNKDVPFFTGMESIKSPVVKASTDENLFNYSDVSAGMVIWNVSENVNIFEDGWFSNNVGNHELGVGFMLRKCIKVKPNTRYYANFPFYMHFMQYNENGDLIKQNWPSISVGSMITAPDAHYINLYPNGGIKESWTEDKRREFQNCYIVESDSEPVYKSTTLTTPNNLVLRKLGDVEDTVDLNTGKMVQRIGISSEFDVMHITLPGYMDNNSCACLIVLKSSELPCKRAIDGTGAVTCDKLPHVNVVWGSGFSQYGISTVNAHYDFAIRLPNSETGITASDTVDQAKEKFRAWLAKNPIKVQYPLATPITKTIDLNIINQTGQKAEKLLPCNGKTHVIATSQTGTLNPIVANKNPEYATIINPNVKYTVLMNHVSEEGNNNPVKLNLGGTEVTANSRVTSITTPSPLKTDTLVMSGSGNALSNVMVIAGDVSGDLAYFEGMRSVKSPVVKTVGENLLETGFESGAIHWNKGYKIDDPTMIRTINPINVDGLSSIYVWSKDLNDCRHIFTYDNNMNFLKIIYNNGNQINLDNEIAFIHLRTEGTIKSLDHYQKSVVVSTSPVTSYEPYKEVVVKTPDDLVLRKIGDAKDVLNMKTSEFTKCVDEIVLNGDEDWQIRSFNTTNNECTIFTMDVEGKISSWDMTSDKFKNTNTDVIKANNIEGLYQGGKGKNIFINISKTKASTVEEFRNWLRSNNVRVQYRCKESVTKVDLTSSGNLEKVVLDGSQTLSQYHNGGSGLVYYGLTISDILPRLQGGKAFVNTLLVPTSEVGYTKYGVSPANSLNILCFSLDGVMSKEEACTYLQANPITVWYQTTANKENTQVKQPLSFPKGQIQVSSPKEDSLTPIVKYEVKTDNSYHMEKLNAAFLLTMKADSATGTLNFGQKSQAMGTNTKFSLSSDDFIAAKRLMVVKGSWTNPMILGGDQTGKTLPYIKTMKHSLDNGVKITSRSRNLADSATVYTNSTENQNDRLWTISEKGNGRVLAQLSNPNSVTGNAYVASLKVEVKPGTAYTLKYRTKVNGKEVFSNYDAHVYSNGETWSATQLNSDTQKGVTKFTTNADTQFIVIGLGHTDLNGEKTVEIFDIMLNKGETAIDYEPFMKDELVGKLEYGLVNVNGVRDEVSVDSVTGKARIIKRIKKVVLNGDEEWRLGGLLDKDTYRIFDLRVADASSEAVDPLCDKQRFWTYGSKLISTSMDRRFIDDLETFKRYLKANPLTVYYVLEKPEIIELPKKNLKVTPNGKIEIDSFLTPKVKFRPQINKYKLLTTGSKLESRTLLADGNVTIVKGNVMHDHLKPTLPYNMDIMSVKNPVVEMGTSIALKDIELNRIDDNTYDYVNFVTRKVVRRVGKVVLRGEASEGWNYNGMNDDGSVRLYVLLPNARSGKITTVCNQRNQTTISSKDTYYVNGHAFFGFASGFDAGSVRDNVKNLLSKNPIVLLYPLNKPVYESLPEGVEGLPKPTLRTVIKSDELSPISKYRVPLSNQFYAPLMKPNTKYTLVGDKSEVSVMENGQEVRKQGQVISIGAISDNVLMFDTKPTSCMLVEGDITNDVNTPVFTGTLVSSTNIGVVSTEVNGENIKASTEITLRSLPNGVRDTLNLITGEYVRRVGEYTFGSNNAWSIEQYLDEFLTFYSPVSDAIADFDNYGKSRLYCDKLQVNASHYLYNDNIEGVSTLNGTKQIRIKLSKSRLSSHDLNGFRAWVQANPITIQYELATPVTTFIDPKILTKQNLKLSRLPIYKDGEFKGDSSTEVYPQIKELSVDYSKLLTVSTDNVVTVDGRSIEEVTVYGNSIKSEGETTYRSIEKVDIAITGENLWIPVYDDLRGVGLAAGEVLKLSNVFEISETRKTYPVQDLGVNFIGNEFFFRPKTVQKILGFQVNLKPNSTYTIFYNVEHSGAVGGTHMWVLGLDTHSLAYGYENAERLFKFVFRTDANGRLIGTTWDNYGVFLSLSDKTELFPEIVHVYNIGLYEGDLTKESADYSNVVNLNKTLTSPLRGNIKNQDKLSIFGKKGEEIHVMANNDTEITVSDSVIKHEGQISSSLEQEKAKPSMEIMTSNAKIMTNSIVRPKFSLQGKKYKVNINPSVNYKVRFNINGLGEDQTTVVKVNLGGSLRDVNVNKNGSFNLDIVTPDKLANSTLTIKTGKSITISGVFVTPIEDRVLGTERFETTKSVGFGQNNKINLTNKESFKLPCELRRLPNGVCDEYIPERGLVIKRIEMVILDGKECTIVKETGVTSCSTVGFIITGLHKPKKVATVDDGQGLIANKLKVFTQQELLASNEEGISEEVYGIKEGKSGIRVRVLRSKLADNTEKAFKDYLSNNPITVLYEMAKPEMLTLDAKAITYNVTKGQNLTVTNIGMRVKPTMVFKSRAAYETGFRAGVNYIASCICDSDVVMDIDGTEYTLTNTDSNNPNLRTVKFRATASMRKVQFKNPGKTIRNVQVKQESMGTVFSNGLENIKGQIGIKSTNHNLLKAENLIEKSDVDKHGLGYWSNNNAGVVSVDDVNLYNGRKTLKVKNHSGTAHLGIIKLARNTTYVYSMMIHSSKSLPMHETSPLHMWLGTSNGSPTHLEIVKAASHNQIPANEWTKIWVIFSTPDEADAYYMRPFVYGISDATVNFCQPMLEKGEEASEWCEALTDFKYSSETITKPTMDLADGYYVASAKINNIRKTDNIAHDFTLGFEDLTGNTVCLGETRVSTDNAVMKSGIFHVNSGNKLTGVKVVDSVAEKTATYTVNELTLRHFDTLQEAQAYEHVYTPYEEADFTITLPENVEMNSVPNGVCDEIDTEKGVFIQRVGKYVIDPETAKLTLYSTNSDVLAIRVTVDKLGNRPMGRTNWYCDKIEDDTNAVDKTTYHAGVVMTSNSSARGLFYIKFSPEELLTFDLDGAKQWLTTNKPVLYYELAEPVVTPLEKLNIAVPQISVVPNLNINTTGQKLKPELEFTNYNTKVLTPNTRYYTLIFNNEGRTSASKVTYRGVTTTFNSVVGENRVLIDTGAEKSANLDQNLVLDVPTATISKLMLLQGDHVSNASQIGVNNFVKGVESIAEHEVNEAGRYIVTIASNETKRSIELTEPLRGITAFNAHDEIDYITNRLVRRIGKLVLNGTEEWVKEEDWSNSTARYKLAINVDIKEAMMAIASNNVSINNTTSNKELANIMEFDAESVKLVSKLTTLDSFKDSLRTSPITVFYVLGTPIENEIPLLNGALPTYNGVTKVSSTNRIPAYVNYRAAEYKVMIKPATNYTVVFTMDKYLSTENITVSLGGKIADAVTLLDNKNTYKVSITTVSELVSDVLTISCALAKVSNVMLLEGNHVDNKFVPKYLEGIKSVGTYNSKTNKYDIHIKTTDIHGNMGTNPADNHEISISLNEPLRKLPNGVCDLVTYDLALSRPVVIRNIRRVMLDGTETWVNGATDLDFICGSETTCNIISDKFASVSKVIGDGNNSVELISMTNGTVQLHNVSDIQATLKKSPVTCYVQQPASYEVATIVGGKTLSMLPGKTVLSADTDVKPEIKLMPLTHLLKVKPNSTYTLYLNAVKNPDYPSDIEDRIIINACGVDYTISNAELSNISKLYKVVITTPASVRNKNFLTIKNPGIMVSRIRLIEGNSSQSSEYIPHNINGLASVGEENNTVSIASIGLNMFNDALAHNKGIKLTNVASFKQSFHTAISNPITTTEKVLFGIASATKEVKKDLVTLRGGLTYTVSFEMKLNSGTANVEFALQSLDSSRNILHGYTVTGLSNTFVKHSFQYTASETETAVVPNIFVRNAANAVIEVKNVQIERGKVATDYSEHQQVVQDIVLSRPLARLSSTVYDEITAREQVIRRVGRLVLDSTNRIKHISAINGLEVFKVDVSDLNIQPNGLALSDRFVITTDMNADYESMYIGNGEITIKMRNLVQGSENAMEFLEQFIISYPITVLYELASEEVEAADVHQASTFKGTTWIHSLNSVLPYLYARVPMSTASIVTKLNNRIDTLQATIDDLTATQKALNTLIMMVSKMPNSDTTGLVDYLVLQIKTGAMTKEDVYENYPELRDAIEAKVSLLGF